MNVEIKKTWQEVLTERSMTEPIILSEVPGERKVYLYRGIRCHLYRREFDGNSAFQKNVQETRTFISLEQNKGDDSDFLTYQLPVSKWAC